MSTGPMRRGFVVGTLVALAALAMCWSSAGSAAADAASDRYEQYRYALETINLSYSQYVVRQNDFRAQGCANGASGCRKPSPYNAFDWTDDGCSGAEQIGGLSNVYRSLFNEPCRLHDFGYRNFGKGLTLYRHEDMRKRIDDRFKAEMVRLCNDKYQGWTKYLNWAACQNEASAVYATVRRLSNWGSGGTPPAQPDACPSGDFSGSTTDGTCGSPPPAKDNCPTGDVSGSLYDGACGSATSDPNASPASAPTIQLSQGAPATYGYWYNVYLSGFAPGSQVALTCHDSIDPGGFLSKTLTVDVFGHAGDATLCYSGDRPGHWVTSSNGIDSNHLTW